jgi:drug/metabolite transporter (DMT)-like permease
MARLSNPSPPPTPPRSPFLTPPPRPPLPPASAELQQRGWAALLLSVLSLLAVTAGTGNVQRGVYVIAVALAVAIAGLILAFTTISAARRAGTRRPRGVVAGAVLGVVGSLFCSFALAGFLLFWTQLQQYGHCLNAANTTAAQQTCQHQLDNAVSNKIRNLSAN